jgi:hypothetical protein
MSFKHHNQTLYVLASLAVVLFLLSGCKRSSVDARNNVLSGLSQPVRVSSGDTDAAEPAIATSPDGDVYVAWVNHGPKSGADVMIARFSSDGQMQGSTARVNPQAGNATAWRGDPPTIAVAPDHTVYIGWTARADSESGHATDLYLSSSRDRGQTFNAPVKVNDDNKPAVHGMHSLAVGNDGRIYVAWLDERSMASMPTKDPKMEADAKSHHMENNREVFFATSTDGGRTFSTNQRVATDVCPCCKTALAISPDGRLYLGWRQVLPGDLRHIAVASSADQGKTFSAPRIVSDDQWVLAGCPVSGPSLSIDKTGALNVLWYSEGKNGQTGLYWSQSNDNGATFGARKLLAAGQTRGTPLLVADNGVMKSVWEDREGGKSRLLTANFKDSTAATDSLLIAADGELPAVSATRQRMFIAYIAKEGRQVIRLVSATF